jgi:glycosyltransferase involved in cell wall biosynthesis
VDESKLHVVHNAVTRKEQATALRGEKRVSEPIVLFLGRITFQKGPDYFLEAARRVVDLEPNVKFVMVGSGDMLPKMVERAARMGLARHVHFTGFLGGADVERIYSMADLYVMPSVSEPFGISPLEALALDVPVIVSRQSGVSEVLRNALKVDFWDVDEIANKILALLRLPALREYVLARGRDEVRAMSWEDRARKLREVYAAAEHDFDFDYEGRRRSGPAPAEGTLVEAPPLSGPAASGHTNSIWIPDEFSATR